MNNINRKNNSGLRLKISDSNHPFTNEWIKIVNINTNKEFKVKIKNGYGEISELEPGDYSILNLEKSPEEMIKNTQEKTFTSNIEPFSVEEKSKNNLYFSHEIKVDPGETLILDFVIKDDENDHVQMRDHPDLKKNKFFIKDNQIIEIDVKLKDNNQIEITDVSYFKNSMKKENEQTPTTNEDRDKSKIKNHDFSVPSLEQFNYKNWRKGYQKGIVDRSIDGNSENWYCWNFDENSSELKREHIKVLHDIIQRLKLIRKSDKNSYLELNSYSGFFESKIKNKNFSGQINKNVTDYLIKTEFQDISELINHIWGEAYPNNPHKNGTELYRIYNTGILLTIHFTPTIPYSGLDK